MNKQDIRKRYWRKSESLPLGDLHHRIGCEIFELHICTCGLVLDLSQLKSNPEKIFKRWPMTKQWHEKATGEATRYFGGCKMTEYCHQDRT